MSIVHLRRRSRSQSVQVDRGWLTNLYNPEITAGSVCTERRMGRVLFHFLLGKRRAVNRCRRCLRLLFKADNADKADGSFPATRSYELRAHTGSESFQSGQG